MRSVDAHAYRDRPERERAARPPRRAPRWSRESGRSSANPRDATAPLMRACRDLSSMPPPDDEPSAHSECCSWFLERRGSRLHAGGLPEPQPRRLRGLPPTAPSTGTECSTNASLPFREDLLPVASNDKMVRANGVDLCVEAFGDPADPAILLIMGAAASMLLWEEEFCERLVAGERYVIRYDHRDTGRSVSYEAGGSTVHAPRSGRGCRRSPRHTQSAESQSSRHVDGRGDRANRGARPSRSCCLANADLDRPGNSRA